MPNFTMNISGNVALANGDVRSFESTFDSRFSQGSVDADVSFQSVLDNDFADTSLGISGFLTAILPTVISGWTTGAGSAVSSYIFHCSGNVARDDGSNTGFDFEVNTGGEIIDHLENESVDAMNLIAADAGANAFFTEVVQNLVAAATVS